MRISIQSKIIGFSILGLVICIAIFGGLYINSSSKFIENDFKQNLKFQSEIQTIIISHRLKSIEQYVNALAVAIKGELTSIDQLKNQETQEVFTEKIRGIINSTINDKDKAVAAYLRYTPQFTPPTSGIFMAKQKKDGIIESVTPTDFSKYPSNDIEHVGWYYIPVESGKPLWMEPYLNKNIDIYMISYVVPLFKYRTEIGVVGVDIDFEYLTREIASIKMFNSGYAFLEDKMGKILYHPTIANGRTFEQSSRDEIVRNKLPNGMNLVFVVNNDEIRNKQDDIIKQTVTFALLLLTGFCFFALYIANSISKPIKQLTDSANRLGGGNMNVKFDISQNNEIGDLAKGLFSAKMRISETIGQMRGLAYRDTLTCVRNKIAFNAYIEEFNAKITSGDITSFGLIVIDTLNLKDINANYGKERGDLYLKNTSLLICRTYSHSPVFRISGDEFVIILQNENLQNHETLMEKLQEGIKNSQENANPWSRIAVIHSTVIYEKAQSATLGEALKSANEQMCKQKKA